MAIHDSAIAEQVQHNLNTLSSIITYFCLLLGTRGVQLNLIAEGNIGALEVDRLILAVDLDRNGEEEFQPTVPDVVRAQHKAFHPGLAREQEVLPVVPMVLFTWEQPALKRLMSLVNNVADSRKMTIIDGKAMFLC